MKAKLRCLETIAVFMVAILDLCLIGLNIISKKYEAIIELRSTANYMETYEVSESQKKEDIQEISSTVIEESVSNEEVEKTEEDYIVYNNMTLEELAEKLNKSLNSTISGKGYLIASYSLEKGVDPYMATAIMLHETGCKWQCSYLVRECNNVGGQKGTGCGSYSSFPSLEEGIKAFIDNLYRNYISYGLTTPEQINPKYAEDTSWASKVNKYIENIKAQ